MLSMSTNSRNNKLKQRFAHKPTENEHTHTSISKNHLTPAPLPITTSLKHAL